MDAKDFLRRHIEVIKQSLEDYQKWFNEGEDNHNSCEDALDDLKHLTLYEPTPEGEPEHTLFITMKVEVSSPEYESVESIIDEFGSECDYSFPNTPCVRVHSTEWLDSSTQNPMP